MADAYSDIALEATRTSGNPVRLSPGAKDGKKKVWTYAQSGVSGTPNTVGLFVLRANEVLDTHHMSLAFSALGGGRLISIGHDGYTLADGTVVAAAPAAFGSAIVATSAGRAVIRDAPTNPVDSFGPVNADVMIVAQVTGGTTPDAATLNGSADVGQP